MQDNKHRIQQIIVNNDIETNINNPMKALSLSSEAIEARDNRNETEV